jgi:hypothetical protein
MKMGKLSKMSDMQAIRMVDTARRLTMAGGRESCPRSLWQEILEAADQIDRAADRIQDQSATIADLKRQLNYAKDSLAVYEGTCKDDPCADCEEERCDIRGEGCER